MPSASTQTSSSKKKKKTTRTKKISFEEAEKQKQEAIDKAVEEERQRADQERIAMEMNTPEDQEYMDNPNFGYTDNNEYFEDVPADDIEDIMDFGLKLEEAGKDISYYIKKDGAFLTEIFTGIPLKDFARKWGGGKFTIAIKDANNRYIKQKTHRIAGDPDPQRNEPSETVIPPQQGMPQMDLNETFKGMTGMFMQMQEMVQRQQSRTERDEKKSSDTFNSTLFNVISEQSKSTQQMIMEMQKNNMEMIKSMSENTQRSLEKAEERNRDMIREMRESLGKKDEFGTKDIIALIENSRNNGMDQMKTIMEMGELFAERMTPDTPATPESKESLLGKIVPGVVQLLQTANQKAAAAQPVMPGLPGGGINPTVGQSPIPQAAPQQRPMPNPNQQRPSPGPLPNRRAPGHPMQRQSSPFKGDKGVYREQFAGGPVQKSQKNDLMTLGLPSFSDKGVNVSQKTPQSPLRTVPPTGSDNTLSSEEIIERTNQTMKELSDSNLKGDTMSDEAKESIEQFKQFMPIVRENDVYKKATKAQQHIVELSLPIIAQYINDEKLTPEIVAHFVIDECKNQGFSSQVLAKEFTFDFLLQIASNFGIGEEKKNWFGEFYETIKDTAANAASGEEEPAIS